MAIMGKKVWAVICGAIRQEFEFYSVIAWLCEQRANDLIDGIVLSTWLGEIDKIKYLRNKLRFLDIYIAELPPIEDDIKKCLNINYTRQAAQLKEGLSRVPDDVFVLKCRTDFCINLLNKIQMLLNGKIDLSIGTYGNFKPNLNYRIAVMNYAISAPFCMEDICFLGYKNDLCKMVLYENTYLKFKNFLSPDCLFFLNLFRNEIPLIDEFVSMFVYWTFAWCFKKKASVFLESNIELPGMINKFYATYFVLLYCCFYLCEHNDSLPENYVADAIDIFSCSPSVITIPWITKLKNSDIINKIIAGDIVQTTFNKKLYAEILKNSAPNYLVTNHFTKKDYIETVEFGKKYFNIEGNKWLRNFTQISITKHNFVKFDEAVKILFSELISDIDNNDFTKLFHQILNNKGNYYEKIIEKLDDLKKIDPRIFEIALFTASRGLNPKVLKEIALLLYSGRIGKKNKKAAEFIFKRYENSADFFKWPMVPDKIEALFLYSKYAECLNDTAFSKKFYNSLISDLGLSAEGKIPVSYADAVLDVMKETVETKREEISSNTVIGNILTFLVEICGKDWISNETKQYLLEKFPNEYI